VSTKISSKETTGKKCVILGYPLSVDSPNPPAIPPMVISPLYRLTSGDAANVSILRLANHTGTHVDAPAHVIEDGLKITDFKAEELLFDHPLVVDLPLGDGVVVEPRHLQHAVSVAVEADLLLIRFGYGQVRKTEPVRYSCKCPGFGTAAAEFILQNLPGLRALGMDVPSLSCIEHLEETMAAHNILLGGRGRRFLVIEDMNLEHDLVSLERVWVAPWFVAEIDSAPCTVLGWVLS